ncbi:hypothetical protein [Arthrobacter sp. B2a2-09]|uniref:hypothetical protein n=1 Tax=Arthrobacter sp. B2a2-09 TaxID=2952822 RepID=UPI0022CD3D72|nr:hypothetical protein [Arthrobacter sp. B2a2-09]
MRFKRASQGELVRRAPRADTFKSRDLVDVLRAGLGAWLKDEGFKRLGSNGWTRPLADHHLIIAVQCSQSGWDPRAGNRFVVEFEQSKTPRRATGFNRARVWSLLDELRRREALDIISRVAVSLPDPDEQFLFQLPANVREHYLRSFAPTTATVDSSDVWFAYYDERDAAIWADFLARSLGPALQEFLARLPSYFGHRSLSSDRD